MWHFADSVAASAEFIPRQLAGVKKPPSPGAGRLERRSATALSASIIPVLL